MANTIWEVIFPFLKEEEKKEEEKKEEPKAEEKKEEEKKEEPKEEKKEEEPPKESWVLLLFRGIIQSNGFKSLCKLLSVVFVGIFLILTYGQIKKEEGCVSFETLYARIETQKPLNYFLQGDIDKLVNYVYMEQPYIGYKAHWEKDFRKDIAKEIKALYKDGNLGKKIASSDIKCEYKTDKTTKKNYLVSYCTLEISKKETILLEFTKQEKDKYTITLSSKGSRKEICEEITNYFSYLTHGYINTLNYKIIEGLQSTEKESILSATDSFTLSDKKSSKNKTYSKSIYNTIKLLSNSSINIEDIAFSPYTYDQKKKKIETTLMIYFSSTAKKESGILHQPLYLDFEGYVVAKNGTLYTNHFNESISYLIENLFAPN